MKAAARPAWRPGGRPGRGRARCAGRPRTGPERTRQGGAVERGSQARTRGGPMPRGIEADPAEGGRRGAGGPGPTPERARQGGAVERGSQPWTEAGRRRVASRPIRRRGGRGTRAGHGRRRNGRARAARPNAGAGMARGGPTPRGIEGEAGGPAATPRTPPGTAHLARLLPFLESYAVGARAESKASWNARGSFEKASLNPWCAKTQSTHSQRLTAVIASENVVSTFPGQSTRALDLLCLGSRSYSNVTTENNPNRHGTSRNTVASVRPRVVSNPR